MIGEQIKDILDKKGVTQAELAELVGVSEGHLNRIIKGRSNPAFEKVEKIAVALEIPIEAFHNEEIKAKALAQSNLSKLPKKVLKTLTDKRNTEWILQGVKLKNTQLSVKEIEIAVEMYKQVKEHLSTEKK